MTTVFHELCWSIKHYRSNLLSKCIHFHLLKIYKNVSFLEKVTRTSFWALWLVLGWTSSSGELWRGIRVRVFVNFYSQRSTAVTYVFLRWGEWKNNFLCQCNSVYMYVYIYAWQYLINLKLLNIAAIKKFDPPLYIPWLTCTPVNN